MTFCVEAIYENGVLKPKQPLLLPAGATVQLIITSVDEDHDPLEAVIGSCDGPADGAANHDKYIDSLPGHNRRKYEP